MSPAEGKILFGKRRPLVFGKIGVDFQFQTSVIPSPRKEFSIMLQLDLRLSQTASQSFTRQNYYLKNTYLKITIICLLKLRFLFAISPRQFFELLVLVCNPTLLLAIKEVTQSLFKSFLLPLPLLRRCQMKFFSLILSHLQLKLLVRFFHPPLLQREDT
jgi:hypothetical protein